MRLRSLYIIVCWLLIPCQLFGGVTYNADSGGGSTAWYVRFQIASNTFKSFQLTEGTSGGLGVYSIDDASLVSGGMTATDGEYPFTIRPGTASDTANNNPVSAGIMGWTGVAERPLLAITPLRRVIFVQASGSNSNNGLNRLKPKATLQAAYDASRAGDCVYLIGANDGNITATKRLDWDGDGGSTWTGNTPQQLLEISKGATPASSGSGSTVKHIRFIQSFGGDGVHTFTLYVHADNVTMEDIVCESTGVGGIQVINCKGARMSNVRSTGLNRGILNIGAELYTRSCWGIGNEAGFYMDSNDDTTEDAFWDSEDDKMIRISGESELESTGNNVAQASGFFSEAHSAGHMSHIHLRRPWFDVQVLNPDYLADPATGFPDGIPPVVGFVHIWSDTSAVPPIPIDLTIEGGGGYLKNLAAGPTQHIHGSAGTKARIHAFNHDKSTNSGGDIRVLPESDESVALATRTELTTELTRLDVALSTRLATSGYTVPPTAAANATATRSELATELTRIDVAMSSRFPTSGYTAPDNTSILAIKSTVDENLDAPISGIEVGTTGADSGGGILRAKIADSSLTPDKFLPIIQGEQKRITFIVEADGRFKNVPADAITVKLRDPKKNVITINNAGVTRITEELDVQVFRITLTKEQTAALEAGLLIVEITFDDQKAIMTNAVKIVGKL